MFINPGWPGRSLYVNPCAVFPGSKDDAKPCLALHLILGPNNYVLTYLSLYSSSGLCCINRPVVELSPAPDVVMPLPPFGACLIQ